MVSMAGLPSYNRLWGLLSAITVVDLRHAVDGWAQWLAWTVLWRIEQARKLGQRNTGGLQRRSRVHAGAQVPRCAMLHV
jgi:hypothetical protein